MFVTTGVEQQGRQGVGDGIALYFDFPFEREHQLSCESTMKSFTRYNAIWPGDHSALDVEMDCIRQGGRWKGKSGQQCGEGLPFHYQKMREILWPELDDHRWHRVCRDTILSSKITVLLGCKSSGKTHSCWIYLCEYFCFPEETCVLISSTHMDGLRLRVWAELSMLWQRAVDKFPHLPGYLVDSRVLIATDNIKEVDADDRAMARDWRKGIKGVPCIQNGKFVGIGKFCFPSGTLVDAESGAFALKT